MKITTLKEWKNRVIFWSILYIVLVVIFHLIGVYFATIFLILWMSRKYFPSDKEWINDLGLGSMALLVFTYFLSGNILSGMAVAIFWFLWMSVEKALGWWNKIPPDW